MVREVEDVRTRAICGESLLNEWAAGLAVRILTPVHGDTIAAVVHRTGCAVGRRVPPRALSERKGGKKCPYQCIHSQLHLRHGEGCNANKSDGGEGEEVSMKPAKDAMPTRRSDKEGGEVSSEPAECTERHDVYAAVVARSSCYRRRS